MNGLAHLQAQPDAVLLQQMLGLIEDLPSANHGKLSTYSRGGCRCEPCKAASHAYYLTRYKAGPVVHGTSSTYTNRGCRCGDCTAAQRVYQQTYRARLKAEGL